MSDPVYRCPACNNVLTQKPIPNSNHVLVFCGVGLCDDQLCNDGETGPTVREAAYALHRKYNLYHTSDPSRERRYWDDQRTTWDGAVDG
jgi:hypothetical protein